MKEYVALVGGRYTYKEDWRNMNELALSMSKIFSECDDFVISGCEITGSAGNRTIGSGYIWMDGKVRYFEGQSGVDLTTDNYLVADTLSISTKYSGGGSQTGTTNYRAIWSNSIPATGISYITIQSNGSMPNINDKFFGKYSILSNPSSSQQSVSKLLVLLNGLTTKGAINLGDGSTEPRFNINRIASTGKLSQFSQTINADGKGAINMNYDNSLFSAMTFDPIAGSYTLTVNGEDLLVADVNGVRIKSLSYDAEINNDDISIVGDSINKTSGDNDTSSIRINNVGYNGATSRFRNFEIQNGKGASIAEFIGASKLAEFFGEVSQASASITGISLKHTTKLKSDTTYQKSIVWKDSVGDSMFSFGYLSTEDQNFTLDNLALGDIILSPKQNLISLKPIIEEGSLLSDRYASISSLTSGLSGKVDKVAGYGLSENDFTDALLAKVNAISSGAVDIGSQGFVTGAQVASALTLKMDKASNLSDLEDKTAALEELDAYNKSTTDGKYLQVSNNLSELDPNSIRTNINAAKVGDSYTKAETYSKSEVYTKNESNDSYQSKLTDTGWLAATNTENTSNFAIKTRQIGNIVNIIGSASKRGANVVWFTLPNGVSAPPHSTGAVLDTDANDGAKYNRGFIIKCDGGSKNFTVRQSSGAKDIQYINMTYFV